MSSRYGMHVSRVFPAEESLPFERVAYHGSVSCDTREELEVGKGATSGTATSAYPRRVESPGTIGG